MRITLLLHFEPVGDEVTWWAESEDVPGFVAAAPTLVDLRDHALEVLREMFGDTVVIVEQLTA